MAKILIVDDDKEIRANLAEIMADAGYETQQAASGRDAVEKAANDDFDVVLLDLVMPKMSGSDVLGELKRVSPRSKVIMITAFATIENAVDAVKRGASDYLTKPFKIDDILMRVRRVLEEARVDVSAEKRELDCTMSALSNPIRRTIMRLLTQRNSMRLMELVRELGIEDHTKVIFHLKILREAGMVQQDRDKSYSLMQEGVKALDCLNVLEKYFPA
ncbi:MAG TPA: response regulator [Nitrospirota bacterium]|jgi:DNA-binding NtrC family response regulator|nr:response regulator [Nitrospirota bacterium]